jgi:hypothetical protein
MALILTNADAGQQTGPRQHWAYNGFDCCGTREVYDVLRPRLDPLQAVTYKFQLACQAPAMAMMLRGLGVDEGERVVTLNRTETEFATAHAALDAFIGETWTGTVKETGSCPKSTRKDGKHVWPRGVPDDDPIRACVCCGAPRFKRAPFNAMSDDQCPVLLYGILGLHPERNKQGKVSTDREVLDRIERNSAKARPFVTAIKAIRALHKVIEKLRKCAGGRLWFSMNVGAADTGRWSSSDNPYKRGDNAQNITEKLRKVFVADPGRWMFYADLEQAESNCLAHLAGDKAYIAAHRNGNVHVAVCRLCWPMAAAWTGDDRRDKVLAETTFPVWDKLNPLYRNAKVNAHGSNYVMTPMGVAREAHIPLAAAKEFQRRYFSEFPAIRAYHHYIARVGIEVGELTTPLGRRRQFFGRRWAKGGGIDGHTHRQMVAFGPQSMVADILDTALWHVWNEMDPVELEVLVQVHDAILGQWVSGVGSKSERAIERLVELMQMPVTVTDFMGVQRLMKIPVEVKVGRNWGKWDATTNMEGLR